MILVDQHIHTNFDVEVILLLFRMSMYNTWDWRDLHHHMPRLAISHGKQ